MARLNKAGYVLTRNLAKPFRIQKGPLPNGSFGILSSWGPRVLLPGPKKGRRVEKQRKNPCRLLTNLEVVRSTSNDAWESAKQRRLEFIKRTRSQLITLRTIGDYLNRDILPMDLRKDLARLSFYLVETLDKEQFAALLLRDEHQIRSIEGQLKTQGLGRISLKQIFRNVRNSLKQMEL